MASNCTGPRHGSDFDGLEPDEVARTFAAYKLLGEAFEEEDAAGMEGRDCLLDDPLALVSERGD